MSPLLIKELRQLRSSLLLGTALGAFVIATSVALQDPFAHSDSLLYTSAESLLYQPGYWLPLFWLVCAISSAISWGTEFSSKTDAGLLCQSQSRSTILQDKSIALLFTLAIVSALFATIGPAAPLVASAIFTIGVTPWISFRLRNSQAIFWILIFGFVIIYMITSVFMDVQGWSPSEGRWMATNALLAVGCSAFVSALFLFKRWTSLQHESFQVSARQRTAPTAKRARSREQSVRPELAFVLNELRIFRGSILITLALVAITPIGLLLIQFWSQAFSSNPTFRSQASDMIPFFSRNALILLPLIVGVEGATRDKEYGVRTTLILQPRKIRSLWMGKLITVGVVASILFLGGHLLLDTVSRFAPTLSDENTRILDTLFKNPAGFLAMSALTAAAATLSAIAAAGATSFLQSLPRATVTTLMALFVPLYLTQEPTSPVHSRNLMPALLAFLLVIWFARSYAIDAFAGRVSARRWSHILNLAILVGWLIILALPIPFQARAWELLTKTTDPTQDRFDTGVFMPDAHQFAPSREAYYYIAPDHSLWAFPKISRHAKHLLSLEDHWRPSKIDTASHWKKISTYWMSPATITPALGGALPILSPQYNLSDGILALSEQGEIWEWRTSSDKERQSPRSNRFTARQVAADSGPWRDIATYQWFVAALHEDGSLWTWTGPNGAPTLFESDRNRNWRQVEFVHAGFPGLILLSEEGRLGRIPVGISNQLNTNSLTMGSLTIPKEGPRNVARITPIPRDFSTYPFSELSFHPHQGVAGITRDQQIWYLSRTTWKPLFHDIPHRLPYYPNQPHITLLGLKDSIQREEPITVWKFPKTNPTQSQQYTAREAGLLDESGQKSTPWTSASGPWRITADGSVWSAPTEASNNSLWIPKWLRNLYHDFLIPERFRFYRVGRIDLQSGRVQYRN